MRQHASLRWWVNVTAQAVALQEHAAPGSNPLQCGDCPPDTGAAPLHGLLRPVPLQEQTSPAHCLHAPQG